MNVIGLYMILLMIYMYPSLPTETCFLTGKGKLNSMILLKHVC